MLNLKQYLNVLLCVVLLLFYSGNANAQCNFTGNQYPAGTVALPTSNGLSSQINTCNYAGEFAATSGTIAGANYTVTATGTTYITVRSGTSGGAVVAMGFAPLTFTAPTAAALFIHFSTGPAPGCGTTPLGPCLITSITINSGGVLAAPCNAVVAMPACGTAIATSILNGAGNWNNYGQYLMPGREALYTYTPTVTGTYTITVNTFSLATTFYCDFLFKPVSSGCNTTGWTQIDDFNAPGISTTFNLTAGVAYYFVIDRESPTTSTLNVNWRLDCATPSFDPCASILASATCGNSNNTVIASGNGVWTGAGPFPDPGKEAIYTYTPTATGNYTLTVNSLSYTLDYIDIFYKTSSVGCNNTGWTFIDDFNAAGTTVTFAMTAGTQYYIMIDAAHTAGLTVNWKIDCLAPPFDPCASIPTITCGTAVTATIASGSGIWSSLFCGFNTPGKEQLYSFTPTVTGPYTLNVNSAPTGGYIDFAWKAASGGCNSAGWTCIDDINFTGAFPIGTLTAGTQYYFLLDPEVAGANSVNFTINGTSATTPTVTATPATTCGGNTTLSITSGTLNNNTTWSWYSGSCGGTAAGTGTSIVVAPGSTTTYFVRGTGGTCAAAGACGQVTVNVNTAPAITGQPSATNVCAGNALNLSVTTSNAAGYQWYRNGLPIGGATSATYNVPSATTANAGSYYVIVTGNAPCGNATSNTVTVNVADPAVITTPPPANISLCEAGTLTISVTASNAASYQWYRNGLPIGGATSATYSVVGVTSANAGTYHVVVGGNSPCGSVTSSNTVVTVTTPPSISANPPATVSLCVGSALNLSVTASNAASYQWYQNSAPIPGATGASYNVASVTTTAVGSYYVVAFGNSPCGNATSTTTTVSVTQPATIVTQPAANVGVCQGGTLTLAVTATGATGYQWYKDNVLLPGEIAPTFTVGSASVANTGTYHLVMGSNSPCGNVQTMNYVVTITPNPTITTQPPILVSTCAGTPLNISVTAANAASYQWYKDNILIPGATAATYNVPSSTVANQGLYHVIAIGNNGCGTVQSTNSFASITPPATITGQPAATTTICAGSALNLSATITNAAGYQWYKNSILIPGATNAIYNVGSATTTDAGTYHVVASSNAPCGNATSSNAVVNVTTPASITTPPPAAITVCNGSGLTISVAGANTTGYQWYKNNVLIPGATSATYSLAVATLANAGTYHVVLGSNSPCAAATSSNCIVTVNPRPTAVMTTNSPATICNGQFASMSVAFTGTGPWTFTRFNGTASVTETVSSNPYVFFFTPTVTTTYSITALNDISCTAIPADYAGTATATVNPRPTALISVVGASTICNGSSANMSIALTGTAPWTFNYSNGVTSTQVTTSVNPYTFTVSPSVTGTYTLNVLLDANCIATPADYAGSATVTVNPRPTAALNISGSPTLCNGGSTTMHVAFTGTAPWTFNYSNGSTTTTVTTSTNPYTFTVNPSVTTTYTITSLVDVNCTALPVDYAGPKTVNVNARPTAAISMSGASTVCNGTSTNINIVLTGTGPWSFDYTDGNTTNSITTATSPYTLSVTPSTTSAYSISGLIDANCTAIPADYAGSVTVIVNPRPTAAVVVTGATTVCDGTATNVAVNLTGTGPWLFQYSDGSSTTTVGTPTTPYSFTVSPSATTTYSVTMLSDNYCSAIAADMTTTGTVNVNPRPTATIAATSASTICDGSSVNMDVILTGTGPWTFDYSDGTTPTSITTATSPYSFVVSPNVSTTYSITSLVDANCTAQASDFAATAPITVNHEATIVTPPQAVTECSGVGTSLTVVATGTGLNYQWMKDGVNLSDNATYSGTLTDVLTISNITGTSGSYQVVIGGVCPPSVTSTGVTVTEDVNNIWHGAIDQAWSVAGNWSCGTIPIVTTNVLIPGNALLEPLVDIPGAICNTLSIEPSATVAFTGVNNALEIKSIITNDGTFDAVLGKVILSGTSAQNIPGVIYKDLEIEGGSTKSLDGNATITGTLSLMDGYISLGEYDLALDAPVQTMGGSASSFIVTNDTGVVVGKNMGATGNPDAVMFHVGTDNASYTPIKLENLGTADDYSVRVMPHVYVDGYGVNPLMVVNPVTDRTWMVTEGVPGGSIVNMNPYWNIVEEINGFDQTHVYVAHFTGGEWTAHIDSAINAPAAGTFGTMFFADADSIDTFSPFTVASIHQFPLSIKLNDISATNVGTSNRVDWSSSSEDKGDIYHLERSTDGKVFKHIADINAKGEAATYTHWDETPVIGRNYYRLRMAAPDGKIYYSKVVSALVKGSDAPFSLSVYPNPVQHSVSLSVNGDIAGKASVVVTDMSGKVVRAPQQLVGRTLYINMETLAQGMYFIKYSDDTHSETIRVNKSNE